MTPRRQASLDRTLFAISALYEAALEERLWPQALAELTALTGSQASSFWVLDAPDSRLSTFVSINFETRAVNEYLQGMARMDPTVRYLLEHPRESIVHDGMLGAGRDEPSRCYADWHRRNVETRYRLVGQTDTGTGVQAGVALHRTARAGRYAEADIDRFALVHEHLRRALGIAVRLGSLQTLQQLSGELLDRSSAAILLLDIAGRVVFMNRTAGELHNQRDGIRVSTSGIRLTDRAEDARFQAILRRISGSVQRAGRSLGDVMRSTRPSGRQPHTLWITGLSAPPRALAGLRAAACVVIHDPERPSGPPLEHLQALYRMTRAEARLALCLARGESLKGAAGQLGITYGTARSRLTQLLQKTHTHSQSALIGLLLKATGLG